jgi:hypothetical protein
MGKFLEIIMLFFDEQRLVTGKGYKPPRIGKSGSQSHLERGPVIIPIPKKFLGSVSVIQVS